MNCWFLNLLSRLCDNLRKVAMKKVLWSELFSIPSLYLRYPIKYGRSNFPLY